MFINDQINDKRLSRSVFKSNWHYISHIPWILRECGNIVAFSSRPLERCIGQFKKLIKSKSDPGANAANVMDRILLFNMFSQCGGMDREDIPVIQPRSYKDASFLDNRSNPRITTQLWQPIQSFFFTDYPSLNITSDHFNAALKHYYKRSKISFTPLTNEPFQPSLQVWFDEHHIYGSELHRIKKNETRRSNHYIFFVE
jgi:hypothetical protein